jgi:hypothetical protein
VLARPQIGGTIANQLPVCDPAQALEPRASGPGFATVTVCVLNKEMKYESNCCPLIRRS